MPKPNENLIKLHQSLLNDGTGFNVPFAQFEKDMQDEQKLIKLHKSLMSDGSGFNVPLDTFKADMGYGVDDGVDSMPGENVNPEDIVQSGPVSGIKEGWKAGVKQLKSGLMEVGANLMGIAPGTPTGMANQVLQRSLQGTAGEGTDPLSIEQKRIKDEADKINESIPEGEGFAYQLGTFLPQAIGIVAATASAPFTGGTSLAAVPGIIGGANIALLVGSSMGSAMNTYEEYMKESGKEANEVALWGVGIGAGAAEYFAERIGLGRYLPKNGMVKGITKIFGQGGEGMAENIFKKFAKSEAFGAVAKKYGLNAIKHAGEEGFEEVATELGNVAIEYMYKGMEDGPGWEDIAERSWQSFQGGALMGGFISPVSTWSRSSIVKKSRQQKGYVALITDKDGNPYEGLYRNDQKGGYDVVNPQGKEVFLKDEEIENVSRFGLKDFDKFISMAKEGKQIGTQLQGEAELDLELKGIDSEVNAKLYRGQETFPLMVNGVEQEDPDVVITVQTQNGNTYQIIDGGVNESDAAAPLIGVNLKTGEKEIISSNDVSHTDIVPAEQMKAELRAEAHNRIKSKYQLQTIAAQVQDEFQPGDQITFNGQQAEIVDVTDPTQGVAIKIIDAKGGEQVVTIGPDQLGALQPLNAQAETQGQPQTGQTQKWTVGKKQFNYTQNDDGSIFIQFADGKDETKAIAGEIDETQYDIVPVTEEVPIPNVPAFVKKKTNTVIRGINLVPKAQVNEGQPGSDQGTTVTPEVNQPEQQAAVQAPSQGEEGTARPVQQNTDGVGDVAAEAAVPVLEDKDDLFDEAVRIVTETQDGSISNLQRKLRLGYIRTGKIMDQLEKAGIVRLVEGTTKREVVQKSTNPEVTNQEVTNQPTNEQDIQGQPENEGVQPKEAQTPETVTAETAKESDGGGVEAKNTQWKPKTEDERILRSYKGRYYKDPITGLIHTVEGYNSGILRLEETETGKSKRVKEEGNEWLTQWLDVTDEVKNELKGIQSESSGYQNVSNYDVTQYQDNVFEVKEYGKSDAPTIRVEMGEAFSYDLATFTKDGKVVKKLSAEERSRILNAIQNHVEKFNPESKRREIEKFLNTPSGTVEAKIKQTTPEKVQDTPASPTPASPVVNEQAAGVNGEYAPLKMRGKEWNYTGKVNEKNGDLEFSDPDGNTMWVAKTAVKKASDRPKTAGQHLENILIKNDIKDAESNVNPAPTEKQKEAGNYQKGHVKVNGFDVSIENPKGSIRSGIDKNGNKWSVEMKNTYGYFKRTNGKDGDHIDVFIGDNPTSEKVFVVDQINPDTGKFDESKVMLGFNTAEEAKLAYLSNYSPGWKGLGSITETYVADFKKWLYDGARQNKAFAEYKDTPEPIQPKPTTAGAKLEQILAESKPKEPKAKKTKQLSKEQQQVKMMDFFSPSNLALQYFASGGKLNTSSLFELFGKSGKENDPKTRAKVESERRPRFTWVSKSGETIDQIAHRLWEDNSFLNFDTGDYRDAIEDAILGFTSPQAMAKELLRIHEQQQGQVPEGWKSPEEIEAIDRKAEDEYVKIFIENLSDYPSQHEIDLLFLPYEQETDGKQETDQAGDLPVVQQDGTGESSADGNISPESETDTPKGIKGESPSESTAGNPTRAEQIKAQKEVIGKLEKKLSKANNNLSKLRESLRKYDNVGQIDMLSNVIEGADRLDFGEKQQERAEMVAKIKAAEKEVKDISDEIISEHNILEGIGQVKAEIPESVEPTQPTTAGEKLEMMLETPPIQPETTNLPSEKIEDTEYNVPDNFNYESISNFHSELSSGKVGIDDFKKAFSVFEKSKDEIGTELEGKTKAQLLELMGSYSRARYKNEKKSDIVKALVDDMGMSFNLNDMFSYSYGENPDDILRKKVNNYSQSDIDKHVESVKKRREERQREYDKFKKALLNPETLEEYKTFIRSKGKDALTTEQRAAYDDLITDKVIDKRKSDAEKKAEVKSVEIGDTGMSIIESKHTKTGEDLYVVQLSDRVERETYNELNARAKELGGYYSSFRGNGAVPGFTFKDKAQAEKFINLKDGNVSNIDKVNDQIENKIQNRATKLRDNANSIIDKVDNELGRDRLTNTAKRAREASSTEARLNGEKRIAQTMLNIADAIDNGEVKLLDGITAKTHIELLDGLINTARYEEIKAKYPDVNYDERRAKESEPPTIETVEYAKGTFFPKLYKERISDLIKSSSTTPGLKLIAARWAKKLSSSRDKDYYQTSSDSDVQELNQMIKANSQDKWRNMHIENAIADHNRLKKMGIENDAMLRSALREYIQYRGKKQEVDKVKQLERAIVGKNVGFDFFPTPQGVAQAMVDQADIAEGMDVLEPSAGNGNIADAIKETGVYPDVIELSSQLAEILTAKGYNVVDSDFMSYSDKQYDRIIMNPPFSNGADGEHVQHAYELLKPGGRIVAIVGEGTFTRNDKKAVAFRDWLESVGGTEERLPDKTFSDKKLLNTTQANARLVVIDKSDDTRFRILGETGFYSTVENALDKIKQDKGTPEQFKAMLLKNGAKQAEMDWMDFDGSFDGKRSVTRQEVQDWIDSNRIDVQEVVKGGFEWKGNDLIVNGEVVANLTHNEDGTWSFQSDFSEGEDSWETKFDAQKEAEEATIGDAYSPDATKYSQYQLPGGENYKELLLTMPVKKVDADYHKENGIWIATKDGKELGRSENISELRSSIGDDYANNGFQSSHFNEPNILAHIRFNERTDADGNRVLFLEEIQSDWAQKGKKEGFKQNEANPNLIIAEENRKWIVKNTDTGEVLSTFEKEMDAIEFKLSKLNQNGKVPDMPFKKTDQWVNLSLRRVMRYAAENGFDRIAWTNGEQQAARYDLSKQIKSLEYGQRDNGNYDLNYIENDSRNAEWKSLGKDIPESNLQDYVGKDIAEKIINKEGNGRVLHGVDLKVGGSGMKAFYDAIIPSAANKLGKPFGAKVENTRIDIKPEITETGINTETGDIEAEPTNKYATVQSLPVTDAMRESVREGQPLFRKGEDTETDILSSFIKKADEVQARSDRAKELGKQFGVPVRVATNRNQLPERIQRKMNAGLLYPGVYDGRTGQVYILVNEAQDITDIEKTIAHEIVAHKGLRDMLGAEQFDTLLDDVYDKMNNSDKLIISKQYGTTDSKVIADEYIASLAETGNFPTWFNRVIGEVRSLLRSAGFKVDFTDADIMYMLWKSRKRLMKQAGLAGYVEYKAKEADVVENVRFSSKPLPLGEKTEGMGKTITINGKERSTTNSKGQPIAQTKEGIENFYKWFGDSKVTDDQGRPLVVYHGTTEIFENFSKEKLGSKNALAQSAYEGFFFAGSPETADGYTTNMTNIQMKGFFGHQDVVDIYNKIKANYEDESAKIQAKLNEINKEKQVDIDALYEVAYAALDKEGLSPSLIQNLKYLLVDSPKMVAIEAKYKDRYAELDEERMALNVKQNEELELEYNAANGKGASIMPVYLSADNTFVFDYGGADRGGDIFSEIIQKAKKEGKNGVIFKNVQDGAEIYDNIYVVIEPTQIKSATGNDGSFDPNNNDISFRISPKNKPSGLDPRMVEGKFNKKRELLQDKMLAGKILMETIKSRGGNTPQSTDFYNAENRMQSRSMAMIDDFNDEELDKLNTTLAEIVFKHGIDLKGINQYLKAKSSIERNDNEGTAAISDDPMADWSRDKVDDIISDFEGKVPAGIVSKLWDDVKACTDFTIKQLYLGNVISKSAYEGMKARKYYVPLKSWHFEEGENPVDFYEYANGDGTAYQGLRKAKGRSSEADDPLAYIESAAHSAIVSANRNMMKHKALMLARMNQNMKDLMNIKKVYVMEKGTDADGNPIYNDVIKDGEDAFSINGYDAGGNAIMVNEGNFQDLYDAGTIESKINRKHTARRPKYNAAQHEIEVYENGERYIVAYGDPNVANAINNANIYNPKLTRWVQDAWLLGRLNRWVSANFTAKNPAFIPINWLRDLGYAATSHALRKDGNLKGFSTNYLKAIKGINNYLTGKADPANKEIDKLYKAFRDFGGETGFVHLREIKDLQKNIQREVNIKGGKREGFDKVRENAVYKMLGKSLDYMALMSENSARFATFLASVEDGKSYEQAATEAKNISVNFNRKGTASGLFGSFFAFFNASIQGGHNFAHMSKHNKKQMAVAATSFLVAGVMLAELLRFWGPEDEDGNKEYDKLPDWIRKQCLVIPTGGDGFATIPLPFGFREIYGVGVSISDAIHSKITASDFIFETVEGAVSAFSPIQINNNELKQGRAPLRNFVPTVAVPFYDIIVNQDFTGREIYKTPYTKGMERYTPNSELGAYNANTVIKTIAQKLNKLGGGNEYTPAGLNIKDGEVDYSGTRQFLYDWNPSKAEHLLEYYLGGRGRFFNDIFKTVQGAVSSEKEVQTYNIPVFKRLYMTPYKGGTWNDYSEIRTEVDDFKYLLKKSEQNGDYQTLERLYGNTKMRAISEMYDAYDKSIKEFSDVIEVLQDPEEKKKVRDERELIMKAFIKQVREINKPN